MATVAIAGSSGLIGSALVCALRAADHRVLRIVRRAPSNSDELFWNPDTGEFDANALRGVDAAVNLCGVSVGAERWSGAFKQSLRDSRIDPTEVLAAAVAEAGVGRLVNASAVGYYGDTGDRIVDETAPPGRGFLAQLCRDWEAATAPAQHAGVRVVLAAHRAGALAARRDAGPAAAAVLAGAGRPTRQRPPVHAVDQPRRRGPRAAVRDLPRRAVGPGEPHRAGAGHQRRVHRGAWAAR